MFKPTHFKFDNAVMWPGAGPTTEIEAAHIYKVTDEGETYTFVHSSGYAFQIDKSQVTPYGFWAADDAPNLPTPDQYNDGIPADDTDKTGEELDQDKSDAVDPSPIDNMGDTPDIGDTTGDDVPKAPDPEPIPSDTGIQSPTNDDAPNTDTSLQGDDAQDENQIVPPEEIVAPSVDPDAGTQDAPQDPASDATDTSGDDTTTYTPESPTDIGSALAAGDSIDSDSVQPTDQSEVPSLLTPKAKRKKK